MDYFQGVVTEYLRADRSVFINTELLIQLEPGDTPPKGRHWYCDAAAVNFRESTIYLCEVTYSKSLQSLVSRLNAWGSHWNEIRESIKRDCGVPSSWQVRPWVFIPATHHDLFKRKIDALNSEISSEHSMPSPLVTYLESVLPWNYKTWNREDVSLEKDA